MDAPVRIVNAPRKAAATDATEHPVTIHDFEGGWHGVTYKATQVSVSPDGSITLPKHLRPEDVEEFVAALRAAAPVASEVRAKAAAIVNARGVPADPRRVLSERWQQAMPTAPTPALSARPARPAFTAERLAAARAKLGGES